MEKVSLSDIRKELSFANKEELVSICLRMARLKKENKEHLAYLLFSKDETMFIAEINQEVTLAMHDLRNINTFQAKKVLQKIKSFACQRSMRWKSCFILSGKWSRRKYLILHLLTCFSSTPSRSSNLVRYYLVLMKIFRLITNLKLKSYVPGFLFSLESDLDS